MDQYVFLTVSQNIYTWVQDTEKNATVFNKKITTQIEICEQGRLGTNKEKNDYLGINYLYLCPKTFLTRFKEVFL